MSTFFRGDVRCHKSHVHRFLPFLPWIRKKNFQKLPVFQWEVLLPRARFHWKLLQRPVEEAFDIHMVHMSWSHIGLCIEVDGLVMSVVTCGYPMR